MAGGWQELWLQHHFSMACGIFGFLSACELVRLVHSRVLVTASEFRGFWFNDTGSEGIDYDLWVWLYLGHNYFNELDIQRFVRLVALLKINGSGICRRFLFRCGADLDVVGAYFCR